MFCIILIWYPKCSTCQRAKKFLEAKKLNFQLRNIVEDTLTVEELRSFICKSSRKIKTFFNSSGLKYRELKLKDKLDKMSDDEKLQLLASDGMLIKRPLLVCDDNVLIGFREKEWEFI